MLSCFMTCLFLRRLHTAKVPNGVSVQINISLKGIFFTAKDVHFFLFTSYICTAVSP